MSEEQSFEKELAELEKTVRQMEQGDISLDESIKLFEKGMALSSSCAKRLEEAHRRILTLTDAEAEENDYDS